MNCKEFSHELMNNGKMLDLMGYLWGRWQEEKEYEDINEYTVPIAKTYANVKKAHKRPFGFSFECDDGTLRVEIRRKGNQLTFTSKKVI